MFDEIVSTKTQNSKVTVETAVLSPAPGVKNAIACFCSLTNLIRL